MAVLQHVGPKVSAEERDQAEVKLSAVTRNTNKKGTAHIKSANKPEARRGKEGKFSNKSAAGAERGRQGSGEEQALAAYGDFIKISLAGSQKGIRFSSVIICTSPHYLRKD